jgi:zinc transport system substrate-binding protein
LLTLFTSAVGVAEPLRVIVSVLPLKTFVQKVGGARVDVGVMVQPGYNPHTYDPTPRQISALAKANLYVRTGVPFEKAWMNRIRSANPNMQVLDVRDGIALSAMQPHQHADRGPATQRAQIDGPTNERAPKPRNNTIHDRPYAHELDPHVWTSPPLAKHMIRAIRDKLVDLDPAHAHDYQQNFAAFDNELDALDREIRQSLEPLKYRRFMVFHPAWGYFAETYGLVQVPIEREGKEPGARALSALIERAAKEQVRVIFVQPQFDKRTAAQLAQAIGGRVIAVDPLAADYISNLRHVAQQFAQALRP